ncbi:MAG: ATP-dependent helicase [Firmicutes bacterium]|nr:ATP-dependent helicase [Bacillota bacterium]
MKFTKEQETIISLPSNGVYRIVAAAGSGKTGTLVKRIQHLTRTLSPNKILAVTFTSQAAKEMTQRLVRDGYNQCKVSTLHSFGFSVLREYWGTAKGKSVIDAEERKGIIKEAMKPINEHDYDPDIFTVSFVLGFISACKNSLIHPQDVNRYSIESFPMFAIGSPQDDDDFEYDEDDRNSNIALAKRHFQLSIQLYTLYEKVMEQRNQIDFDDMLYKAYYVLEENPKVLRLWQQRYSHVLVDEAQDTNPGQWKLIHLLAQQNRNLFIVGDDCQSIYSFRGADPQTFIDFEQRYPECQTFMLTRNFRSSFQIVSLGEKIIQHNINRVPKNVDVPPERMNGAEVSVTTALSDPAEEARYVVRQIQEAMKTEPNKSYNDFAVIYRINAQSAPVEIELIASDMPYRIHGGTSFFEHTEIKDIMAYVRLIEESPKDADVERVINVPNRFLGTAFVHKAKEYAKQHRVTLLDACKMAHAYASDQQAKEAIGFYGLIRSLSEEIKEESSVVNALKTILKKVEYETYLNKRASVTSDDETNVNVQQLFHIAARFDGTLSQFIAFTERVAKQAKSAKAQSVTLMTIHKSKGLEFDTVFLIGATDDVLPIEQAVKEGAEAIEEERRIAYVGITRAKEKLHITAPMISVRSKEYGVSRFITEADLESPTTHEPTPEALLAEIERLKSENEYLMLCMEALRRENDMLKQPVTQPHEEALLS